MLIQSLSPSFLSLALNNPVFPSYVNIAMKKIENDSEGTLEVESCRQKHFSIMKGFWKTLVKGLSWWFSGSDSVSNPGGPGLILVQGTRSN